VRILRFPAEPPAQENDSGVIKSATAIGFVLDVCNANTYDLPLPRMLYQAGA